MERCSRRRRSRSFNSMDNLSDDLVVEILTKIPDSRSTVRCKAVCKRWLSIISDPCFVHRSIHGHHQYPAQLHNLLLKYIEGRHTSEQVWKHLHQISNHHNSSSSNSQQHHHILQFVPCFREHDPEPICVVAYFNDLLVCCENSSNQRTYYICNPITKRWLMLPPAPSFHEVKGTQVGFVCYPAYCCEKNATNAGYQYKVVRIIITSKFIAEIFSSENGEWRKLEVSSPRQLHECDSIVTYNGILHWVDQKSEIIVAYDPLHNVDQCRIIDPPNLMSKKQVILGVCKESLRMFQLTCSVFPDDDDPSLSVWELEDYILGKWRLIHKVYLRNAVSDDSLLLKLARQPLPIVRMLAFHPVDADLVFLNFSNSLVVTYNMRTTMLLRISKVPNLWEIVWFSKWEYIIPIVHPWWPTPVPPLPLPPCC